MKYSQFNSIVAHDEQYALYNSFNQKVILLVPELKELLEAGINEGIDGLQEIHPTFYDYLIEQEFLLDENINEVDKVKALTKQTDENNSSYILTINPTMNCNFKCWYCYETHIKKSRLDDEMIERIKKFISNRIDNNTDLKSFSLAFFGGEPLLYFKSNVKPIIEYFYNKCSEKEIAMDISFTTNGYLINEDFISFFDNIGFKCGLQITLDGYKEEHDKVRYVSQNKGSYEEIIKNIRLLISNNFYVRLRVNYTDKNIENTDKIADEFSDLPKEILSNLTFDFHRVWQDYKIDNTVDVLDKNIDSIREKGIDAKSGYAPNNVKDSCYADKRNSVVVNYNGDIYKCTARDFLSKNRAGYIDVNGELIWENDYLNRRMNAKFKNKPCLTCRLMPICNGGCSQHAMEKVGQDYCVYYGDESEKDKVVRTKIDEILLSVPAE